MESLSYRVAKMINILKVSAPVLAVWLLRYAVDAGLESSWKPTSRKSIF